MNLPEQMERRLLLLLASLMGLLVVAGVILAFLLQRMIHPQPASMKPSAKKSIQAPAPKEPEPVIASVVDGVDVATGLVAVGDYQLVKANCTACHSSKLVLQNRATREGWQEMIRWMQETQNLWDLGENEDKILDYLATHYAPASQGRRAPLVVNEWYEIQP